VRRFIQLYKAMKQIQAAQAQGKTYKEYTSETSKSNVINADYKVVD
jgi:hypothetical protein